MFTKNYLIEALIKNKKLAIVPDSNFPVSCIIKDTENNIYSGANIEFCDRTLGICAEGAAISRMLSENGYKQISEVWLTGGCGEDENSPLYPCGICLQRIAELGNDNTIIYSVSSSTKKVIKFHLKELLPYSNTFKDDIPLSETKIDFSTTSNDMYVILQILLKRNFAPDNKKKEAVILKTDKNHLIFGVYFSSCCYKADIHAINMAIYNFLLSEYKNENITDLFYYTSDQKGLFIHPEFQKIIKDAIITKFRY